MSLRAFVITVLLILVILSIGMRGGPEGRYAPGVLVQSDPLQREPTSRTKWKLGDYLVTPLADYDITARIVAKSSYWGDAESAVSPLDP